MYIIINQFYYYFHTSPIFTFNDKRESFIYLYYPYHSVFDMQKDERRERMFYCLDVNTQLENSSLE